eukprot:2942422-Rhodomonas_salina.1
MEIDPNASEEERRIVMNYLVDRLKFNEIRVASSFEDSNSVINARPETVRLRNGINHQVVRTVYFYNPEVKTVERRMTCPETSFHLGDSVPRGVFSEDHTELLQIAEAANARAEEQLREARQHADGKASEVKKSQQE